MDLAKYDVNLEKILRAKIDKDFPNHMIIGEEFDIKKTKSKFEWILDPIDGTKVLTGQPTWSNLISLYYMKKPIFGLANFPKMEKNFF